MAIQPGKQLCHVFRGAQVQAEPKVEALEVFVVSPHTLRRFIVEAFRSA
jgi:hypothetical protein